VTRFATHVCGTSTYRSGDPGPDGYLEWFAWADVQHRAGLRQAPCPECGRWRFPQETCDHGGAPFAGWCTWREDEDGIWNTACGKLWELTTGDPPAAHDMFYCHHCGRRLVAIANGGET